MSDPLSGPLGLVLSEEQQTVLTGSLLPGSDDASLNLSPKQIEELERDCHQILTAYDQQMIDKKRRWRDIDKAYDLVSDKSRAGIKPDAAHLVSELTRSHVNIATARIVAGVIGLPPNIQVQVIDDQEPDDETQALVELAKQTEQFLSTYFETEMDAPRWLPLALHRATRQSNCIVRAMWEIEEYPYSYRENGRVVTKTTERGRVNVDLIPNENVIVWPLDQTDIGKMRVCGHDTWMSRSEFRAFCNRLGVNPKLRDELLVKAGAASDDRENHDEALRNKDVDPDSQNPFDGEVRVTELWMKTTLGDDADERYIQLFYHRDTRMLLWAGHNPLLYGRCHPYVDFCYWREDGSFWGSGVGHELLWSQAADSSLLNMLVDNLRVVGHNIRILRFGSMAQEQLDDIGPGKNVVTEDPEGDVRLESLGGELGHILQAFEQVWFRATRSTGITHPLQGMNDPTLKSGASPSSLQQLIEQAGKKFDRVDANLRKGVTDLGMLVLELIQQYAPSGVFYQYASEGSAQTLRRLQFQAPDADLRRRLRLQVRAPSAAANKEVLGQKLSIAYKMVLDHLSFLMQAGQQVLGQENPAGFQRLLRDSLELAQHIFKSMVESNDVPGLAAKVPDIPEETPQDALINQLRQQLQQMQQRMMQMQQQAQQVAQPPQGAVA